MMHYTEGILMKLLFSLLISALILVTGCQISNESTAESEIRSNANSSSSSYSSAWQPTILEPIVGSREQDSLALVSINKANNNILNREWPSNQSLEYWWGITLSEDRVVSIDFSDTHWWLGKAAHTTSGLNSHTVSLTSLPEEIKYLTHLKRLDLNYSSLNKLPPEIGYLTNLDTLSLSKNEISSLPDEIGYLTNLYWLVLNDNPLSSFPQSFSFLSSLKILNASGTSLHTIPHSLTKLSDLKTLVIKNTQMSVIPDGISSMNSLTYIDLSENSISEIPKSIYQLSALTHLILDGNLIEEIPEELSAHSNLTNFNISRNLISIIPSSFFTDSPLKKIWLPGNKICSPNEALYTWLISLPATLGLQDCYERPYSIQYYSEGYPGQYEGEEAEATYLFESEEEIESTFSWWSTLLNDEDRTVGWDSSVVIGFSAGLKMQASVWDLKPLEIRDTPDTLYVTWQLYKTSCGGNDAESAPLLLVSIEPGDREIVQNVLQFEGSWCSLYE